MLGARSLTASILSSTYVVFKKKFGNSSTSLLLSRNRLGKITCDDKVLKACGYYHCHGIPITERLVTDKIQSNKGKPVL